MSESLFARLGETEGIRKHGRSDETKKDVLAILYSLKDEIIRV